MPTDVTIRCSCGQLRGVARGLSSSAGNRSVCYCDDCQSFAYFLDRPSEMLDGHGGTDIFQTSPARIEFRQGADQIACVRLTEKGLLRWHTRCCNTAIGNTPPIYGLPFVGLIHTCMDHEADSQSSEDALGPVRNRVNGRFAKGQLGDSADGMNWLSVFFRLMPMIAIARLRGDQKRGPFFDPRTAEPRVTPRVLSEDELRSVETARDAA